MLFDPERKTRIDTDERVLASDPRRAHKLCEEIAEQERQRGELTASVRGRVMSFGEWCDANPDTN